MQTSLEALFQFTPYGLFVMLALLAGLITGSVYLLRAREHAWHVELTFCVLIVPCVWFFSRLFFVLANCTYYLTTLSNPFLALRFWDGGYSMSGAFAGACVGAVLAAKICRVSAPVMLDAVGMGFPVSVILARLSEIGTGLGEGRAVTWSWIPPLSPEGYDGPMHPVFLYEAIAALIIFVILVRVAKSHHGHPHEGDLLLMCMTLYGVSQIFLESLRDDGHMVVHFVRIQQVLALLMILIVLIICAARCRAHRKAVVICSVITLMAVGLAVLSEFGVDRWGNRVLAYGLMIGCLLAILGCTLYLYCKTFSFETRPGETMNAVQEKQND